MIFRTATEADIPGIMDVRMAVKENVLSNPDAVTAADCVPFLTTRGRGWVCEVNGQIVGFAIVDLQEDNVWALFLAPEHEGRGIGGKLHDDMLDWYFSQRPGPIWLGTDPGTRAEGFYRKRGWQQTGMQDNGEIRFEHHRESWNHRPV